MAITNRNCFLATRNRADEAVLTGGAWTGGLPLSNLLTRVQAEVARTPNTLAASSQFSVALARPRPIRAFGLANHNLSPDAAFRVRAFSDAAHTDQVWDGTVLPVWLPLFSTADLAWEDSNFWFGTIPAEELVGFKWLLTLLLPTLVYQQYWLIELIDTGNPDGYIEVGRLFMSDGWQPTKNMKFGAALQYESGTTFEEADDGTEYPDVKPAYRVATFDLVNLTETEAMVRVFDAQRVSDTYGETLFVWDPTDTLHAVRRTFLGRVRKLSPIERINAPENSAAFEIKEI